jgi:5-hydroxyisourate hydrolase
MAKISTHVLDVALGRPAEGIPVDLYFGPELKGSASTNSDGRTDEPLLAGAEISPGAYDLVFHAGDYLRRAGTPDPLFFDIITIRFHVGDQAGSYHVPLLLAPHAYSTYRGS